MKLIKSRKIQLATKKIVVTIAIYSFVFTMLVPQTVSAGPIDVFNSLVDKVMEEFEPTSFPVAGERLPVKTIKVVSTAYSSDVWQTDDTPCIPASGYNLCDHYEKYGEGDTVAANFLPLGTKVRFPELYGDKVFIVRDRMNARYGYGRIDIWMPEYLEAKNFGVKRGLVMEIF
jgi:3D (Asp-Asp-Asp) domain-containing protein